MGGSTLSTGINMLSCDHNAGWNPDLTNIITFQGEWLLLKEGRLYQLCPFLEASLEAGLENVCFAKQ